MVALSNELALAQQRAAQAQSAAAPTPRRAGGNKAPRAAGSAAAAKQRPAATARATASARPVRNAHLDATMKVANKQLKAAASRVKSAERAVRKVEDISHPFDEAKWTKAQDKLESARGAYYRMQRNPPAELTQRVNTMARASQRLFNRSVALSHEADQHWQAFQRGVEDAESRYRQAFDQSQRLSTASIQMLDRMQAMYRKYGVAENGYGALGWVLGGG